MTWSSNAQKTTNYLHFLGGEFLHMPGGEQQVSLGSRKSEEKHGADSVLCFCGKGKVG